MAQPRFHQGKGDTGIDRLTPAESEPLHQHPHHLGHVGVGIRIGRAPTDHHQQGVGHRHLRGLGQGLTDAGSCRRDHQPVNPQFPAVINGQSRFSAVGVEHRRNVVLGMPGREKHGGNGQHFLHALRSQVLETITQDGLGEFKESVFHRKPFQPLFEADRQALELLNRQTIATAVTTDQNTVLLCIRNFDLQRHTGNASSLNLFGAGEGKRR